MWHSLYMRSMFCFVLLPLLFQRRSVAVEMLYFLWIVDAAACSMNWAL
jgi:hypothetical protein